MCGRFVRISSVESIAGEFNVGEASLEMVTSYNISPTQDVVILIHEQAQDSLLSAVGVSFLTGQGTLPSAAG